VKKFYAVRIMSVVGTIVTLVVASGAANKFGWF
jgi:hypothetical protein